MSTKLKKERSLDDFNQEMIRLAKTGLNPEQISHHMGLGPNLVGYISYLLRRTL